MKYVFAIAACFVLFLLYALISGLLGWRHGGGAIPLLVFLTAICAVWVAITRRNKTDVTAEINPGVNPAMRYSTNSIEPLDENWAKAMEEFDGADRNQAIYARLFAAFCGDEARVKAAYLRERAVALQKISDIENARGYLISKGYTVVESSELTKDPVLSAEALIDLARSVKAGGRDL